jgi:hypothetical protein
MIVYYGPEHTSHGDFTPIVVIERDHTRVDSVDAPLGAQRNPRKHAVRRLSVEVRVYARSTLGGAQLGDHERECEALVDAVITTLDEWVTEAKAGEVAYRDTRYLSSEDRADVETWPGVVYMLSLTIGRGVFKKDYDGSALPTGQPGGLKSTTSVRYTGQQESPPETGCGG